MVCVHNTYSESHNTLLRYGRVKFSKMAAGRHLEFDPTGNGAVGSAVPENPTLEPNTKSIGWHVAEIWPFGFPRWPPAAILNLIQPKMAPLDPPSPKTPPENQTWGGSADTSLRYGRLKFSQNVWIGPEVGRSLVGRWSLVVSRRSSIFILLTLISYTPLSLR